MGTWGAVLFDLDDTLIDRQGAFRRWAQSLPCEPELLIAMDGGGRRPRAAFVAQAVAAFPALAPDAAAFERRLREELPRHVAPSPAALELLAAVRARRPAVLVSNGGGPMQRAKLAAAGLDRHLDGVFISGEVGSAKPSPAIFLAALAHVRCPAREAIFVGDDPVNDVAGAAALGMATVWLAHGRSLPAGVPRPTHTVAALAEAHEVLA